MSVACELIFQMDENNFQFQDAKPQDVVTEIKRIVDERKKIAETFVSFKENDAQITVLQLAPPDIRSIQKQLDQFRRDIPAAEALTVEQIWELVQHRIANRKIISARLSQEFSVGDPALDRRIFTEEERKNLAGIVGVIASPDAYTPTQINEELSYVAEALRTGSLDLANTSAYKTATEKETEETIVLRAAYGLYRKNNAGSPAEMHISKVSPILSRLKTWTDTKARTAALANAAFEVKMEGLAEQAKVAYRDTFLKRVNEMKGPTINPNEVDKILLRLKESRQAGTAAMIVNLAFLDYRHLRGDVPVSANQMLDDYIEDLALMQALNYRTLGEVMPFEVVDGQIKTYRRGKQRILGPSESWSMFATRQQIKVERFTNDLRKITNDRVNDIRFLYKVYSAQLQDTISRNEEIFLLRQFLKVDSQLGDEAGPADRILARYDILAVYKDTMNQIQDPNIIRSVVERFVEKYKPGSEKDRSDATEVASVNLSKMSANEREYFLARDKALKKYRDSQDPAGVVAGEIDQGVSAYKRVFGKQLALSKGERKDISDEMLREGSPAFDIMIVKFQLRDKLVQAYNEVAEEKLNLSKRKDRQKIDSWAWEILRGMSSEDKTSKGISRAVENFKDQRIRINLFDKLFNENIPGLLFNDDGKQPKSEREKKEETRAREIEMSRFGAQSLIAGLSDQDVENWFETAKMIYGKSTDRGEILKALRIADQIFQYGIAQRVKDTGKSERIKAATDKAQEIFTTGVEKLYDIQPSAALQEEKPLSAREAVGYSKAHFAKRQLFQLLRPMPTIEKYLKYEADSKAWDRILEAIKTRVEAMSKVDGGIDATYLQDLLDRAGRLYQANVDENYRGTYQDPLNPAPKVARISPLHILIMLDESAMDPVKKIGVMDIIAKEFKMPPSDILIMREHFAKTIEGANARKLAETMDQFSPVPDEAKTGIHRFLSWSGILGLGVNGLLIVGFIIGVLLNIRRSWNKVVRPFLTGKGVEGGFKVSTFKNTWKEKGLKEALKSPARNKNSDYYKTSRRNLVIMLAFSSLISGITWALITGLVVSTTPVAVAHLGTSGMATGIIFALPAIIYLLVPFGHAYSSVVKAIHSKKGGDWKKAGIDTGMFVFKTVMAFGIVALAAFANTWLAIPLLAVFNYMYIMPPLIEQISYLFAANTIGNFKNLLTEIVTVGLTFGTIFWALGALVNLWSWSGIFSGLMSVIAAAWGWLSGTVVAVVSAGSFGGALTAISVALTAVPIWLIAIGGIIGLFFLQRYLLRDSRSKGFSEQEIRAAKDDPFGGRSVEFGALVNYVFNTTEGFNPNGSDFETGSDGRPLLLDSLMEAGPVQNAVLVAFAKKLIVEKDFDKTAKAEIEEILSEKNAAGQEVFPGDKGLYRIREILSGTKRTPGVIPAMVRINLKGKKDQSARAKEAARSKAARVMITKALASALNEVMSNKTLYQTQEGERFSRMLGGVEASLQELMDIQGNTDQAQRKKEMKKKEIANEEALAKEIALLNDEVNLLKKAIRVREGQSAMPAPRSGEPSDQPAEESKEILDTKETVALNRMLINDTFKGDLVPRETILGAVSLLQEQKDYFTEEGSLREIVKKDIGYQKRIAGFKTARDAAKTPEEKAKIQEEWDQYNRDVDSILGTEDFERVMMDVTSALFRPQNAVEARQLISQAFRSQLTNNRAGTLGMPWFNGINNAGDLEKAEAFIKDEMEKAFKGLVELGVPDVVLEKVAERFVMMLAPGSRKPSMVTLESLMSSLGEDGRILKHGERTFAPEELVFEDGEYYFTYPGSDGKPVKDVSRKLEQSMHYRIKHVTKDGKRTYHKNGKFYLDKECSRELPANEVKHTFAIAHKLNMEHIRSRFSSADMDYVDIILEDVEFYQGPASLKEATILEVKSRDKRGKKKVVFLDPEIQYTPENNFVHGSMRMKRSAVTKGMQLYKEGDDFYFDAGLKEKVEKDLTKENNVQAVGEEWYVVADRVTYKAVYEDWVDMRARLQGLSPAAGSSFEKLITQLKSAIEKNEKALTDAGKFQAVWESMYKVEESWKYALTEATPKDAQAEIRETLVEIKKLLAIQDKNGNNLFSDFSETLKKIETGMKAEVEKEKNPIESLLPQQLEREMVTDGEGEERFRYRYVKNGKVNIVPKSLEAEVMTVTGIDGIERHYLSHISITKSLDGSNIAMPDSIVDFARAHIENPEAGSIQGRLSYEGEDPSLMFTAGTTADNQLSPVGAADPQMTGHQRQYGKYSQRQIYLAQMSMATRDFPYGGYYSRLFVFTPNTYEHLINQMKMELLRVKIEADLNESKGDVLRQVLTKMHPKYSAGKIEEKIVTLDLEMKKVPVGKRIAWNNILGYSLDQDFDESLKFIVEYGREFDRVKALALDQRVKKALRDRADWQSWANQWVKTHNFARFFNGEDEWVSNNNSDMQAMIAWCGEHYEELAKYYVNGKFHVTRHNIESLEKLTRDAPFSWEAISLLPQDVFLSMKKRYDEIVRVQEAGDLALAKSNAALWRNYRNSLLVRKDGRALLADDRDMFDDYGTKSAKFYKWKKNDIFTEMMREHGHTFAYYSPQQFANNHPKKALSSNFKWNVMLMIGVLTAFFPFVSGVVLIPLSGYITLVILGVLLTSALTGIAQFQYRRFHFLIHGIMVAKYLEETPGKDLSLWSVKWRFWVAAILAPFFMIPRVLGIDLAQWMGEKLLSSNLYVSRVFDYEEQLIDTFWTGLNKEYGTYVFKEPWTKLFLKMILDPELFVVLLPTIWRRIKFSFMGVDPLKDLYFGQLFNPPAFPPAPVVTEERPMRAGAVNSKAVSTLIGYTVFWGLAMKIAFGSSTLLLGGNPVVLSLIALFAGFSLIFYLLKRNHEVFAAVALVATIVALGFLSGSLLATFFAGLGGMILLVRILNVYRLRYALELVDQSKKPVVKIKLYPDAMKDKDLTARVADDDHRAFLAGEFFRDLTDDEYMTIASHDWIKLGELAEKIVNERMRGVSIGGLTKEDQVWMKWQVQQVLNKVSVDTGNELRKGRNRIRITAVLGTIIAVVSVVFTPGWFVMFLSVGVACLFGIPTGFAMALSMKGRRSEWALGLIGAGSTLVWVLTISAPPVQKFVAYLATLFSEGVPYVQGMTTAMIGDTGVSSGIVLSGMPAVTTLPFTWLFFGQLTAGIVAVGFWLVFIYKVTKKNTWAIAKPVAPKTPGLDTTTDGAPAPTESTPGETATAVPVVPPVSPGEAKAAAPTQAESATPATTAPADSASTPAPAESAPATADTSVEQPPATTEVTPPSAQAQTQAASATQAVGQTQPAEPTESAVSVTPASSPGIYARPEAFADYMRSVRVPDFFAKFPNAKDLYLQYLDAFDRDDKERAKAIAEEIDGFVREYNRVINQVKDYADHVRDFSYDTLTQGPVSNVADEYSSEDVQKAEDLVIGGEEALEFFAAGAATRLGLGNMFLLSPRKFLMVFEVLQKMAAKDTGSLNDEEQDVLRRLQAREEKDLRALEAVSESSIKILKPMQDNYPDYFDLPMAARMLLVRKYEIEDMIRRRMTGRSENEIRAAVAKAIAAQKISVLVNGGVAGEAVEYMERNNFLGFNRENIFFTIQPTFKGVGIDRGSGAVAEVTKTEMVNGHGYPTMQKFFPQQAFYLGADGKPVFLDRPLVSVLHEKGVKLLTVARINDMIYHDFGKSQVEGNAMDLPVLIAKVKEMGGFESLDNPEIGAEQVMELMDNPNKQKGGSFPTTPALAKLGFGIMPDTLAFDAKNDSLAKASVERIEKQIGSGMPYNRMSQSYKLAALNHRLTNGTIKGIPVYLRFRGFTENEPWALAAETVTGDTTFSLKTGAVEQLGQPEQPGQPEQQGRKVRDFKTPKEVPDLLAIFARQNEWFATFKARSEIRSVPVSPVAEGKSYRNFVEGIRAKVEEKIPLTTEEKRRFIDASREEAKRLRNEIMEANRGPKRVFDGSEETTMPRLANDLFENMPDKELLSAGNQLIEWNERISDQISKAPKGDPETEPAVWLPSIGRTEETEGMKALQKAMQREEALHAALNAAANQRLETTGVKSPAAVSVESRLTNLILAIEKQTGKPFPAAFNPDTGAYVTGYNEARIREVLAMKEAGLVAKGVVVVIMAASEDDVRAARNAFGSEIRDRQIEVVGSGANLVAERLKQRYGDSRVQIKPGAVVTEEDEAAYLAAAQLANGRVVFVGTNETVVGAYQISVAVMLQSAMEAAQAIATSA